MKIILTLSVIFVFASLVFTHNAFADTCSYSWTSLTAPQLFLVSDTVFAGTVSSIDNYTNHEWKVAFNAEKVWKGGQGTKISVITNSLRGCGYTLTTGEKYLVYANDSPLYTTFDLTRPFSEVQNDTKLFDDPKFQVEEKIKENLNKKLEVAKNSISNMMVSKTLEIPINSVGVDEINSILEVGIDSTKATLSEEKYQKKLKEIVGDIPIKIEFGQISPTSKNTTDNFMGNDLIPSPILSPLQQFKSGIPSQQVSCKGGLELVIKTNNGHPMCVKPSTKSKLLQKGLAEMPIITEEGFVVSRPDLFLQRPLRIEGLNQTQYVEQKIEFAIEYNGTKSHCSFYPSLHIENAEHKTVWESNYILELCDPDITPAHFEREWKIGGTSLGTPIINKTGSYTLFVEFENDIVQQDFWVKSHSNVKIIGLEDTYKVGDNVKFYVTVQGFGMIPCEDFTVSIKNNRGQTILDVPAYNGSCPIPVEPENYEFYFPQKNDSYVLFVNQTGKYTVSAHFGDDSLEKEFVVKENDQIK